MLWVGGVDRRVKAVMSQVPCVSGWENFHRLIRSDFVKGLNETFQAGMVMGISLRPKIHFRYLTGCVLTLI